MRFDPLKATYRTAEYRPTQPAAAVEPVQAGCEGEFYLIDEGCLYSVVPLIRGIPTRVRAVAHRDLAINEPVLLVPQGDEV